MKSPLLKAFFALILAGLLHAEVPPRIPLETIFADPELQAVQLSPDGRYLTFLAPRNQRMNLAIQDRQTKRVVWLTNMKQESVVNYVWAKPDRLLFAQQLSGRESYGFYAINPDGSNLVIIRQLSQVDENDRVVDSDPQRDIISMLPNDKDCILMSEQRGNSGIGDPIKVNLRTGKMSKVELNDINARVWIADQRGVVRVAICTDMEGPVRILHRRDGNAKWEPLAEYHSEFSLIAAEGSPIEPHWKPVQFAADNRTLYAVSFLEHDKSAVTTFDTETKKFGPVLFTHPRVEPGSRLANYRSGGLGLREAFAGLGFNDAGELASVSYADEKPETKWFDPKLAELARELDAALPTTHNTVVSKTNDGKVMIVLASSDRDPGTFYLYDAGKGEISVIGKTRPKIEAKLMAPMQPIKFAARDGIEIPGYLTLPVGRPAKKLPMILVPHGGPYGPRDVWGFDSQIQFLANRGYAVLQINYRGSGGYGLEFQRGGYRQWGLRMQDDLTDGVKWAIAQGIADPNRVGIFGGSYGGYATLAGLVFTPELYCLGVNLVGVADLELFLFRGTSDFKLPRLMRDVGAITRFDPSRDKPQIKATNPVEFIDRIRVPLFCAYGKNDPRVTFDHWVALESKLKKYGKTYECLIEENEGHGFKKVENRVALYRQVESFLDRNMNVPEGKVILGATTVMPSNTN